jgi:hypothetical protein
MVRGLVRLAVAVLLLVAVPAPAAAAFRFTRDPSLRLSPIAVTKGYAFEYQVHPYEA